MKGSSTAVSTNKQKIDRVKEKSRIVPIFFFIFPPLHFYQISCHISFLSSSFFEEKKEEKNKKNHHAFQRIAWQSCYRASANTIVSIGSTLTSIFFLSFFLFCFLDERSRTLIDKISCWERKKAVYQRFLNRFVKQTLFVCRITHSSLFLNDLFLDALDVNSTYWTIRTLFSRNQYKSYTGRETCLDYEVQVSGFLPTSLSMSGERKKSFLKKLILTIVENLCLSYRYN